MVETYDVTTYKKISYISNVIKGQSPVIYNISQTIILYFIVIFIFNCVYVLCLFSAWHANALIFTPPVSDLR